MRPFDLATWVAIAILVVGASAIFAWFLKDAGRVLRGGDDDRRRGRASGERSAGERFRPRDW